MPIDQDKLAGAVQSPFFIGLLGGIVALRGVPGSSWKERGFNVLSATLIAGFKVPVRIDIQDEPLPRNANGKVLKRDLRQAMAAERAAS